jgi:hypothetical protein
MSNEAKIRLLTSKSHAYWIGLSRAIANGDHEAADKWEKVTAPSGGRLKS